MTDELSMIQRMFVESNFHRIRSRIAQVFSDPEMENDPRFVELCKRKNITHNKEWRPAETDSYGKRFQLRQFITKHPVPGSVYGQPQVTLVIHVGTCSENVSYRCVPVLLALNDLTNEKAPNFTIFIYNPESKETPGLYTGRDYAVATILNLYQIVDDMFISDQLKVYDGMFIK